MATYDNVKDVARAVPSWLAGGLDVDEQLRHPGVLGEALRAHLPPQRRSPPLSPKARAQVAAALRAVPVTAGGAPFTPPPDVPLPSGTFHLVVATKPDLVTETLARLFAIGTIPHSFRSDMLDSQLPVAQLAQVTIGLPADLRYGAVHLDGPPTVVPAPGPVPVFSVRLRIDFERVMVVATGTRRTVVTSLVGTFQIGAGLGIGKSTNGRLLIQLNDLSNYPITNVQFTVDAQSPVKAAAGFAELLLLQEGAIRPGLVDKLNKLLADASIAPVYQVPGVDDTNLYIQDGEVAVTSDGGAIVAGVYVGTTPTGSSNGGEIKSIPNPFVNRPSDWNLWAEGQAALFDQALRAAWKSGALQRYVDEQVEGLNLTGHATVIDTSASIDGGTLTLAVRLELSNICTTTIRIWHRIELTASVQNGVVIVTQTPSTDWWDATLALDLFLCLLSEAAALIFTLGGALLALMYNVLRVAAAQDPGPRMISTVIDPTTPIPGTEALIEVDVHDVNISDGAVHSFGDLSLHDDTLNTYIYARFSRVDLHGSRTPIEGAQVKLLNADAPPPPGNDFTPPPSHKGNTPGTGVDYVPPTVDELLGKATTRGDGIARFMLTPDERNVDAGSVIRTTVKPTSNPHAQPEPTSTITPVLDSTPDLYFVMTAPDGTTLNTRANTILNVTAKHVGTADAPLEYTVGNPIVTSSG